MINGGDCAIMLTRHKWFHLSESAFLTTLSRIIVSLSVKQTTSAARRKLGHVGKQEKAGRSSFFHPMLFSNVHILKGCGGVTGKHCTRGGASVIFSCAVPLLGRNMRRFSELLPTWIMQSVFYRTPPRREMQNWVGWWRAHDESVQPQKTFPCFSPQRCVLVVAKGVAHQASAPRGSGEEELLKRLFNMTACRLSVLKSGFHLILFELLFCSVHIK